MTRSVAILAICMQVLMANAALAAPSCMHADDAPAQPAATQAHASHMDAAADDHGGLSENCECYCGTIGHCTGSAAGTLNSTPADLAFGWTQPVPATRSGALTHAHRNRLFRPPSIA